LQLLLPLVDHAGLDQRRGQARPADVYIGSVACLEALHRLDRVVAYQTGAVIYLLQ